MLRKDNYRNKVSSVNVPSDTNQLDYCKMVLTSSEPDEDKLKKFANMIQSELVEAIGERLENSLPSQINQATADRSQMNQNLKELSSQINKGSTEDIVEDVNDPRRSTPLPLKEKHAYSEKIRLANLLIRELQEQKRMGVVNPEFWEQWSSTLEEGIYSEVLDLVITPEKNIQQQESIGAVSPIYRQQMPLPVEEDIYTEVYEPVETSKENIQQKKGRDVNNPTSSLEEKIPEEANVENPLYKGGLKTSSFGKKSTTNPLHEEKEVVPHLHEEVDPHEYEEIDVNNLLSQGSIIGNLSSEEEGIYEDIDVNNLIYQGAIIGNLSSEEEGEKEEEEGIYEDID